MEILSTSSKISFSDRLDHFSARLGFKRMAHMVTAGIYRLGDPGPESPVFITANYTLSFDALRSNLEGINCFILVLDTKGINVWCAAGKGTFGTGELIHRIEVTDLKSIINHHTLILPQLGAPGVEAHKVEEVTGFKVKYGPVRATDILRYLKLKKTTGDMRKVRFRLADRLVLIPVEFVHILIPLILMGIILYFIAGLLPALAAGSAILAGTVLFPLLIPILPTRNFSTKGYILGIMIAILFGIINLYYQTNFTLTLKIITTCADVLILPPVTAFLALNFTGSTTFTSRTGVRNEIFRYFPSIVWLFASGLILFVLSIVLNYLNK
jgi:hypothetical protein